MHGRATAIRPHGDRSARLVEAPMALGYGDDEVEESALGINLHALRLTMPRGGLLALTILLIALAAGAASIWLAKPIYSTQATIQIDPPASRLLGTGNPAPDAGRSENDRVLQTQADLLASRSTAQNVANRLDLANSPLFLREVGLENEPAGLARSAKVAEALQDRLSVSQPRGTNILAVRVDSHDPAGAARIANMFAETFISDSLKRRLVAGDYSRRFFHGQLELAKARLDQSERNLVDYARSASLVAADLEAAGLAGSDGAHRSITAANLVKLNAAHSRAQANRMQAQQRWQQAISAPAVSNPVSIIDRAQKPVRPAYPRPAMTMALAALVGALALGADLARSRMNKKVGGPIEVERNYDAQLLGVVPLRKDGEDFALDLSGPLSPGTTAHQAIFLALERVARAADHRVLLLTSSCPDEGKSMIAVSLSANFAAAGRKVLVIDTDMRRGSLHRMLGLSNQLGLADLLAKDSTCELTNVAQYRGDCGFSVVPRGQSATNPTELLASRRFADLLDEAANLYDLVIIDGPPVLGPGDAPRLGAIADATVFVLRADRTVPEQAKLAMRRLSEAGAEQIRLVITEFDSAKDFDASDRADSDDHAADEAAEFVPEEPPRAEPAPANRHPLDRQDQQLEPALPDLWASWLLAQQQGGERHDR